MGKILTDEIMEAASELNKCIVANEHALSVLVGLNPVGLFQFSVMSTGSSDPFYFYEHEESERVVEQITCFQSGLWAREVA